jgi:hypothetical protein
MLASEGIQEGSRGAYLRCVDDGEEGWRVRE